VNKTFWQIIGIIVFLIGACTPSATNAPTRVTQTATSAPSPTRTLLPSTTPTITVTPLPTIPTFTPTFDVSTIVTVTPAQKAECPKLDPVVKPEEYLPSEIKYPTSDTVNEILEFLNKGGDGQSLISRLDQIYSKSEYHGGYDFLDITGDQVPEFLYVELNYVGKPMVFSCKSGIFQLLENLSGDFDFLEYALEVEDLNANGLPELIIIGTSGASFPQSKIYIYEWDGQDFQILGTIGISALRKKEFRDVDGNGVKDILLSGDNPTCTSCSNFIPQRERTVILGWNGKEFAEISNEFETPKYRFQAVQDADVATNIGNYDKAMFLYNQVTTDSGLGWWSPDRLIYEQTIHNSVTMFIETPSVTPSVDETEYPRLAAYAYYRIMLIQLVQNQETDATTTYNTLQEKFGNDPYSSPYVEMSSAFWDVYQSTHKMYDGCAAAISICAAMRVITPCC